MKTKICTKCKITKALNEFYKDKNTKDNLTFWCKDCYCHHRIINNKRIKNYQHEWYNRNKKAIIKKTKEWKTKNQHKF